MFASAAEKMKINGYLPNAEAVISAHAVNKNDIVAEAKPSASFTMSKKHRTSRRTLIKEMASVCSIYTAGFGKLVKEHKLGLRKDLRGKLD